VSKVPIGEPNFGNLAADAFAQSALCGSENCCVEGGVASDLKVTPNELLHLTLHIEAFAIAIAQRFKKEFLKDAFTSQFQPFDSSFSNLIIHAVPHRNSKVSKDTIAALNEVSQMLGDQNLMMVRKSFDGDSPYHGLHYRLVNFIEANLAYLEYEDPPEGISLVSCDPSHLEKKARDRVLKGGVCAGSRKTEQIL
jgi:hypothetical protein